MKIEISLDFKAAAIKKYSQFYNLSRVFGIKIKDGCLCSCKWGVREKGEKELPKPFSSLLVLVILFFSQFNFLTIFFLLNHIKLVEQLFTKKKGLKGLII